MSAYLLLGGTTKAATTALFAHLARHPRVSPCRLKEPRFWLDADYPLARPLEAACTRADYEALFPARAQPCVRLEATPDYLHSPGTARRLQAGLPGARVAFSLRDPIARLCSWYRFARSSARLPRAMTLAQYVAVQRARPQGAEQPLRALAQGCYAPDLARYFEALGRARVHVLFYEELLAEPRTVLNALLRFAGLEPELLASQPLASENPTRGVRSPRLHGSYVALGFRLRRWSLARPRLFAALRGVHGLARPLYWLVNGRAEERIELAPELRAELCAYYAPSVARLAELLGRAPPWSGYGLESAQVSHGT